MIDKYNIKSDRLQLFNDEMRFKEMTDSFLADTMKSLNQQDVLLHSLSLLDITTLSDFDYAEAIDKIVKSADYNIKGNRGVVAGICIYSNLLPILNKYNLDKRISKVVVSGGFPTGQMSLSGKLNDIAFAIENDADEIDVPINRGLFFENKDELAIEISAMKSIVRQKTNAKLKVILETSELKTYANVYTSAMIAMQNGADFIKTSTGKTSKGADIYSSCVMMMAIKDFLNDNSDRVVGFKVAGGIRTCEQVIQYYALMHHFFNSKDYINKDTFRIGCSNLKDEIINNIQ